MRSTTALFGWQKADAMDMGAMGTYQIFSIGGAAAGGMFNKPPVVPATFLALLLQCRRLRRRGGTRKGERRRDHQRSDASAGRQLDRPGQGPTGRDVRARREARIAAP